MISPNRVSKNAALMVVVEYLVGIEHVSLDELIRIRPEAFKRGIL